MIQLYTQKTIFDQIDFSWKWWVETEKRYVFFLFYSISISKNCELLGKNPCKYHFRGGFHQREKPWSGLTKKDRFRDFVHLPQLVVSTRLKKCSWNWIISPRMGIKIKMFPRPKSFQRFASSPLQTDGSHGKLFQVNQPMWQLLEAAFVSPKKWIYLEKQQLLLKEVSSSSSPKTKKSAAWKPTARVRYPLFFFEVSCMSKIFQFSGGIDLAEKKKTSWRYKKGPPKPTISVDLSLVIPIYKPVVFHRVCWG